MVIADATAREGTDILVADVLDETDAVENADRALA
jgi:hypothetical protein